MANEEQDITIDTHSLETIMNTTAYGLCRSVISMVDAGEKIEYIREAMQSLVDSLEGKIIEGYPAQFEAVEAEFGFGE